MDLTTVLFRSNKALFSLLLSLKNLLKPPSMQQHQSDLLKFAEQEGVGKINCPVCLLYVKDNDASATLQEC